MQVFDKDGITETIDTAQGGGRELHVAIPCFVDLTAHNGIQETETARCLQGRYQHGFNERKADKSGVAVPIVSSINGSMRIGEKNFNQRNTVNGNGQLCRTLIGSRQGSGSGNEPKVAIPVLTPDRANKRQNGRRFKENGEPSFTLTGQDRHGVAVEVKGIRGGLQEHQSTRTDGVSPTLTSAMGMGGGQTPILEMAVSTEEAEHGGLYVQLSEDVTAYAIWYEKYQCYIAIRKLTPKECWRLQGWADDYFEKAAFVNSDSQLYKQSGNGVTVSVIRAIGEKLKESEEAK